MSGTLKLGTIGAGIMGGRLIAAATGHTGGAIRPHGIFDPDRAASERLRRTHPALIAYESAAALIADCDVVHIASPPASHLAYLAQVTAAGKAALCEKPLATDIAAAREAVEQAERIAARAAVNFPFASSFAVEQLRRWIDDGDIGDVRSIAIEMAFAAWPRPWQVDARGWLDGRAEGGFTREVGSHFLFLARRLFGSLRLESASATFPPVSAAHVASAGGGFVVPPPRLIARSETAITARGHAGAVPMTLAGGVGTTTKPDHNTFEITGSNAVIRLRDWSIAERSDAAGDWHEAPDAMPNDAARMINLARQLDRLAALARGEAVDLATLREALDVQIAVEAILASGG